MGTTKRLTYEQRIKQLADETAYFRYKLHLIISMQLKIDPLNKLYGNLNEKETLYRNCIAINERKIADLTSCTDNLKKTLITYNYANE